MRRTWSDQIRHRAYRVFRIIMVYFSLILNEHWMHCFLCQSRSKMLYAPFNHNSLTLQSKHVQYALTTCPVFFMRQTHSMCGRLWMFIEGMHSAFRKQYSCIWIDELWHGKILLAAIWSQGRGRLYPPCSLSWVERIGLFHRYWWGIRKCHYVCMGPLRTAFGIPHPVSL